jgi:muramoyltetrapeptide carboxypeptidase
MDIESLHAQMPSTIPDSTSFGLDSLRKALFGESLVYNFPNHSKNKLGIAKGELIGGNLSLLVACINSKSDVDYSGKILFIEEVGEYHYTIDRMIRTLDRAGKFKNLAGLILGGFTAIKEDEPYFGYDAHEIIEEVVKKYDFPVCYDFPAGHIKNNCALVFGHKIELNVKSEMVNLNYK